MKFVSKIFVLAFFALACTACGDSGLVIDTSDATMDFSPQDLTINVGDTVTFKMTATHNAVEVSKDVYDQVVGGGLSERLEGNAELRSVLRAHRRHRRHRRRRRARVRRLRPPRPR